MLRETQSLTPNKQLWQGEISLLIEATLSRTNLDAPKRLDDPVPTMTVAIITSRAGSVYLFTIHLLNCASAALLVFIQPTVPKSAVNPQSNQQKNWDIKKKTRPKTKTCWLLSANEHVCAFVSRPESAETRFRLAHSVDTVLLGHVCITLEPIFNS